MAARCTMAAAFAARFQCFMQERIDDRERQIVQLEQSEGQFEPWIPNGPPSEPLPMFTVFLSWMSFCPGCLFVLHVLAKICDDSEPDDTQVLEQTTKAQHGVNDT